MSFVNNVTRFLDSKRVSYTVHTYTYGPETHSATAVADAIGQPREQVFKTLVALPGSGKGKPILAVIPGPDSLDLKKLAKAVGEKKVRMAPRAEAERMTGLLAGGISPLALINRGFVVYLDRSAEQFDRIYLSAGERGAQVGLPVQDFIRLTRARLADLREGGG